MAFKPNKTLILIVKLVVSGGLMYFVLKKAGIEKVFSLLRDINILLFLAAVLIHLAAQFIASVRWKLLLREEHSLKRLFPLYLLGSFFNTFLPGLVGGDAIKAYYLYKETGKGTTSFASIFMDRYIGYVSLMLTGMAAFPFGLKYFKGSWVEWLLPLMALSFALASYVILGLRLGKRFSFLSEVYGYFHYYRKRKDIIVKTILLSVALQSLIIFAIYLLAVGLGRQVPVLALFVFVPIIVTLSSLPISISGVGVREASAVLLLGYIGVSPEMATAISFTWFLSFSASGLAGLYEYLRSREA